MTSQELDALRAEQMARGEKPRYDGRWRPENSAGKDAAAGRDARCCAFAIRTTASWRGTTASRAASRSPTPNSTTWSSPAQDGTPTYNFCVVVDDIDMRDHQRHPRRRPRQQHAAADQHLPRARRRAAGLRARADGAGRGRRQAVQAPRRHGRDGIRGAGLSARGADQFPRAHGLGPRRRGDLHARAAGRSGSTCRASARRRRASTPTS